MLNNPKVGDIVVLVSGGPAMTVVRGIEYTNQRVVKCGWFDSIGQYRELEFQEAILIEQSILDTPMSGIDKPIWTSRGVAQTE